VIAMALTEVAAACGGRLEAVDPALVVTRVTTDSRDVREGDLFVGLRGERFDGDAYAQSALDAGAVAAVVRAETAAGLGRDASRIVVDDGLSALSALAANVRRRSRARVVGITGSAGKTSTKDILAALLRPVARVVATRGNFNNEVGVPLTMLDLEPDTEVLVCELAMRGRGQIAELARLVDPDIGVITNIAPVHLELVGTVEDVAAAKAEIIAGVGHGALVVPVDEALLEPHLGAHTGRLVTFGGGRGDVRVIGADQRGFETHALIDAFGRRASFEFSFSGGHYLQDALAAVAAFLALGYGLDEAKAGAREIAFSELRGELVELADDGLLLNDSYNANPLSVAAAVDHLTAIAGARPRVAMLGDMRELGPDAARFHRQVGEHVAASGARLVAVGELARDYLAGAPDELWFATVDDCLAALPGVVTPGSAVLVKASRALRLERVAEAIVALHGRAVVTTVDGDR
jgi:UDP-N-acetylmuramoyl-tripeptide--D-alanyl-D-alanine ligase